MTDIIVIEVMGRCDLDAPGAKGHIDVLIRDDWNSSARKRKDNFFSHQILVAIIHRADRDSSITQHGFWPCGCDDQELSWFIGKGIAEVPEVTLFFLAFNFKIGDRCL